MSKPREAIESGVPDPFPLMHPVMKENYGRWAWHDRPRPGVLRHVADTGDEVWTVKAGTQRQMDVYTIRKLCRYRRRPSPTAMSVSPRARTSNTWSADEAKVAPLIEALKDSRLPGRRHRQLGVDDLAHPGLAALRYSRHRRVGRGQVADGRAAPRVRQRGDAQPGARSPPRAARSTAAARAISRSTCSTPSRRRSTTIWSPMCANGRR